MLQTAEKEQKIGTLIEKQIIRCLYKRQDEEIRKWTVRVKSQGSVWQCIREEAHGWRRQGAFVYGS